MTSHAQQTARRTTGGTGYLEYLPPDYASSGTKQYPILFFLHGTGETGDGSAAQLERVKVAGPPKHIANGHNMCFTVNGQQECFIVISPQLSGGAGGWWPNILTEIFNYVINGPQNYRIDKSRIYLTGLSLGGQGVYIGAGETPDVFAAAGVIAGFNNGNGCTISARKIAMWGFHGESDGTIPYGNGWTEFHRIEWCTTPSPTEQLIWTSYPGVGHNAWDRAYMTDHTYHNPNLYEWLLTKRKVTLPTASAGIDKSITIPTNSLSIIGSGSIGGAGSISAYSWQKLTGGTATLTNATSSTVTISDLTEGTYSFRLTVTDNNGNKASDDVQVVVNPAVVNAPPTIAAIATITLTLPTNSSNITAVASDNDGTIATYLWSQQSGPSTATLAGVSGATLSVSNLVAGTYSFRLTVTDDDAASAFRDVSVVVNPAAVNQPPSAQAGVDKLINLPTNSTNLIGGGTDPDGSIASYTWEKTTGPAATLANLNTSTLTLTNLVAGSYTFRLTVVDNQGASAFDEAAVVVVASNQAPIANAGIDASITLPTSSITINGSANDADGSIASYLWSQSSGPSAATISNSTSSSFTASNLISGTYIFQLRATDNAGATGTDDMKVTVNAAPVNNPPTAVAGVDISITLPVNSTILVGSGTDTDGSIASYSWIKLSGPSATLTNQNTSSLTVSALIAGSYSFQLTVTDNSGASSTDVALVTVQPAVVNQTPIVNAGTDKQITLPTNTLTLNGSGSDNDGSIASYNWTKEVGPSASFTGQNSSTLQLTALIQGVYTFRLTVTDDKGATAFDETIVTVSSTNQAPQANAGTDISLNLPTNFATITGDGTDTDGTIASYAWVVVSSPASLTLTNQNTKTLGVSGLVVGTYVLKLTVTDNNGSSGSDEVKVIVNALNQIPVANAGGDKLITLPTNTINLTGSATDSDGTIATYLWTQISGATATLTNTATTVLTIVVPSAGSYVFRLAVTDNGGSTDFDEITLTVNPASVNQAPSADAGENKTITLPVNSIVLQGSGSDSDGSITAYQWIKVSGATATLTNESTSTLSLSSLVEGTYVFRLTVTDNGGSTAFSNVTINVLPQTVNQSPSAGAGEDKTLTLPTNSITLFGNGSDPDGSVTSYAWTKISGPAATVANENSPSVSLSNLVEGLYVFRLTVVDDKSSSGSDDVLLTVFAEGVNQLPISNAGSDISIKLPTVIANISGGGSDPDGSIANYLWTKVSGSTATITNSTKATMTASDLVEGNYVFRLTVTDNKGATDVDEMTLTVLAANTNQSPIVSIASASPLILPQNSINLKGTASDADGTVVSYAWTKINGGTATLQDIDKPTLLLTNLIEGSYQFRLTATDNSGAIGTGEVTFEVKPAGTNISPSANAGPDLSLKLPTNSVTVKGLGSDSDGSISSYLWEKTSGPPAVLANQTTANLLITGMSEGSYKFQLTVTDNAGLKNTDEVNILVLSASSNVNPSAEAGSDISLSMPQNTAVIKGSGVDADGSITSYLWTKISGPSAVESGASTATLSLSALTVGTYVYKLTVKDNNGATGSDEITIIVSPSTESFIKTNPPTAHAGEDQVLQPGTKETKLVGTFEDAGIVNKFSWKQLQGAEVSMTGQDSETAIIKNLATGTYLFELTVFNLSGQSGKDEVLVTVSDDIIVNYMKYFSPNGDGINDFWELDPNNSQFANCRLVIFDKHGMRILSTEGYLNNWDAVLNGRQLPEDVYYFVLDCGGKKKSGSITLIR